MTSQELLQKDLATMQAYKDRLAEIDAERTTLLQKIEVQQGYIDRVKTIIVLMSDARDMRTYPEIDFSKLEIGISGRVG